MACLNKFSSLSQRVVRKISNNTPSANFVTMVKYKIQPDHRLQDKVYVKIMQSVNNNNLSLSYKPSTMNISTLARHNTLNKFILQNKSSSTLKSNTVNSQNVLVIQTANSSFMSRKCKTTIESNITKLNSHSYNNIKVMKTSCQMVEMADNMPQIVFSEEDMKNMTNPQKELIRSAQAKSIEDHKEEKITFRVLLHLATFNAVPFIGFGFLDNFIMIVAGDHIDQTFGHVFCISTMAAAALGNTLSDVAGIGLAAYVERLVEFLGFETPKMSEKQHKLTRCRVASNFGRTVGIIIGCLLGMIPLGFMYNASKKDTCPTDVSADPTPDLTRDPNKAKHKSILPVVLTDDTKPSALKEDIKPTDKKSP